jgi:hypothetical protein
MVFLDLEACTGQLKDAAGHSRPEKRTETFIGAPNLDQIRRVDFREAPILLREASF